MTDEVTKNYGEKARIVEFVSTGAKAYAYKVDMGDGTFQYDCKVKGFKLDYETGESINMRSMIDLVEFFLLAWYLQEKLLRK